MMPPTAVLDFWFKKSGPDNWFKKDENFDEVIKEKFESTYWRATRGELYSWRITIEGRLAEIIVLDQFSRNIFRNKAQAFMFDSLAVILRSHSR